MTWAARAPLNREQQRKKKCWLQHNPRESSVNFFSLSRWAFRMCMQIPSSSVLISLDDENGFFSLSAVARDPKGRLIFVKVQIVSLLRDWELKNIQPINTFWGWRWCRARACKFLFLRQCRPRSHVVDSCSHSTCVLIYLSMKMVMKHIYFLICILSFDTTVCTLHLSWNAYFLSLLCIARSDAAAADPNVWDTRLCDCVVCALSKLNWFKQFALFCASAALLCALLVLALIFLDLPIQYSNYFRLDGDLLTR